MAAEPLDLTTDQDKSIKVGLSALRGAAGVAKIDGDLERHSRLLEAATLIECLVIDSRARHDATRRDDAPAPTDWSVEARDGDRSIEIRGHGLSCLAAALGVNPETFFGDGSADVDRDKSPEDAPEHRRQDLDDAHYAIGVLELDVDSFTGRKAERARRGLDVLDKLLAEAKRKPDPRPEPPQLTAGDIRLVQIALEFMGREAADSDEHGRTGRANDLRKARCIIDDLAVGRRRAPQ